MTGEWGTKGTAAEQLRHSGEVSNCQHNEEVGEKYNVCTSASLNMVKTVLKLKPVLPAPAKGPSLTWCEPKQRSADSLQWS